MFEGAISLQCVKSFSYKEACKFYLDASELAAAQSKEMDKIKKAQNNV